jgi:hypothetical protein
VSIVGITAGRLADAVVLKGAEMRIGELVVYYRLFHSAFRGEMGVSNETPNVSSRAIRAVQRRPDPGR